MTKLKLDETLDMNIKFRKTIEARDTLLESICFKVLLGHDARAIISNLKTTIEKKNPKSMHTHKKVY